MQLDRFAGIGERIVLNVLCNILYDSCDLFTPLRNINEHLLAKSFHNWSFVDCQDTSVRYLFVTIG